MSAAFGVWLAVRSASDKRGEQARQQLHDIGMAATQYERDTFERRRTELLEEQRRAEEREYEARIRAENRSYEQALRDQDRAYEAAKQDRQAAAERLRAMGEQSRPRSEGSPPWLVPAPFDLVPRRHFDRSVVVLIAFILAIIFVGLAVFSALDNGAATDVKAGARGSSGPVPEPDTHSSPAGSASPAPSPGESTEPSESQRLDKFSEDAFKYVLTHRSEPDLADGLSDYYDFSQFRWYGEKLSAEQLASRFRPKRSSTKPNKLYPAKFLFECEDDEPSEFLTIRSEVPYRYRGDGPLQYDQVRYRLKRIADQTPGEPFRIVRVDDVKDSIELQNPKGCQ